MKQITNKEYEEWQKYKAEKAKRQTTADTRRHGRILRCADARFLFRVVRRI